MNRSYDAFINSAKNANSKAVYKHYTRIAEYDLSDHSLENLNAFVMSFPLSSIRDYHAFVTTFKAYAKYIEDIRLLKDLDQINIDDVKQHIQYNAIKRYIAYEEYLDLLHTVDMCENFNELFYITLLMCIYEGLFADGFDTLAELRKRDIEGSIVTIHLQDGTTHKIEVSLQLAQNLIELANCNIWEQFGRHNSITTLKTEGRYPDSVFKVAARTSPSNRIDMAGVLRRKYSRLRSEYGFYCNPSQLFYSGMIHRASIACKEQSGLDYIEIFNDTQYRQLVNSLLSNEINRCRYAVNYDVMRYNIADNINDFKST